MGVVLLVLPVLAWATVVALDLATGCVGMTPVFRMWRRRLRRRVRKMADEWNDWPTQWS